MVRPAFTLLTIGLLGLIVAGCSGGSGGGRGFVAPSASSSPIGSTSTPAPSAVPIDSSLWPHPAPLQLVETGEFATSMACARCHGNDPGSTAMRDSKGRGVAPYDLWQASMMANATRDPLWRAEVSVEAAATPALAAQIETKCMSCHAPMAEVEAARKNETISTRTLEKTDPRAHLALDGVSCTACHQIEPAPDVRTTFNGAYRLGTQRQMYGPHDAPFASPMSIRLGFVPAKGDHMMESASCASCHTLYTDAVRADGTPTGGRIPEQTAYLEWKNSVFSTEVATPGPEAQSCQSCHTPTTDVDGDPIRTRIARDGVRDFPGVNPRDPYGRHVFLGGNTLVPSILRDQAADLNPLASSAAFDALIAETRRQLRERTARVGLGSVDRTGDLLSIAAWVQNDTGHKFPTGHPVRRAWLRLLVRDAQGQIVFASGQYDAAGRIVDGQDRRLASEAAGGPTQPHFTRITRSDQVQVYQSLMMDEAGRVTFLLLRGEGYLKDNRLLPRGWSSTGPDAGDTSARGVSDPDFVGGADAIQYEVQAPLADGPYRVELTLLYQPLSARFADELFQWRTPEVEAFKTYYQAADRRPETVATAVRSSP